MFVILQRRKLKQRLDGAQWLIATTKRAEGRAETSLTTQTKTREARIFKVVRQGEAFSVQSTKSETGQIQKCNIVLRELGGGKFENEYVCAMLGNLAACRFYEGDLVIATLRFSTHEYQEQTFQEILATDIAKIN
jgi:hypothetical protein